MSNHFSEKLKNKTDQELTNIVNNPEKYVKELVKAASLELSTRKNKASGHIDIRKAIEESKKLAEQRIPIYKHRPKESLRFIRSFLRLIIRPNSHRIQTSTKNRLLLTIRFYFLTLLFLMVSSIPMVIFEQLGFVTKPEQFNAIPDSFNNPSDIFFTTILIPIIAGLIEETQFRLVLHKYNKTYFDIFVSLFVSYLVTRLFGRYFLTYSQFYSGFLVQTTLIYLIFSAPIYFSLSQSNIHSSWFEKNWNTSFKFLFYTLAVLFAIAHLPTMDLKIEQLLFGPFIILPFFIYALAFSYVRIRIGFQYAVLLHFTIDLIVILVRN